MWMVMMLFRVRVNVTLDCLVDKETSAYAGSNFEQVWPQTAIQAQNAVGTNDVPNGVDGTPVRVPELRVLHARYLHPAA